MKRRCNDLPYLIFLMLGLVLEQSSSNKKVSTKSPTKKVDNVRNMISIELSQKRSIEVNRDIGVIFKVRIHYKSEHQTIKIDIGDLFDAMPSEISEHDLNEAIKNYLAQNEINYRCFFVKKINLKV